MNEANRCVYNPHPGVLLIRSLTDGRDIVVQLLLFNRALITIGPRYAEGWWKDGW